MEAKDYRLGNLVIITHEGNSSIVEVTALGGGYISVKNNEREWTVKDPLIKPIPLDEGWLIKFGFEKKGETFVKYMKPDFIIEINKQGTSHWFPWITERAEMASMNDNVISLNFIDNVHQLQNLYFALTGQELLEKETVT